MHSPGPQVVPNFVKASSLLGLRRLMLMNNLKLGGYVNYFQINQIDDAGKKVWVAWFYEHLPSNDVVESK